MSIFLVQYAQQSRGENTTYLALQVGGVIVGYLFAGIIYGGPPRKEKEHESRHHLSTDVRLQEHFWTILGD